MKKKKGLDKFKVLIISVTLLFVIIKFISFFNENIQKSFTNVDINTFAALITLFIFFIFYTKYTDYSLFTTSLITTIFSAISYSMQYNTVMIVNQDISFNVFMDNFQNGLTFPMLFFGVYFFVNSVFKS